MPAAEVIEPTAIRLWAQRLATELSASAKKKKLQILAQFQKNN